LLLHLGAAAPDLSTSAYGPFVVHDVPTLDEAASALDDQHYDAIVLQLPQPVNRPARRRSRRQMIGLAKRGDSS
jgi:hypothetical protein